ncbi:hypothetical protein BN14_09810 [Rhizoctonia solani AG-1 IB]|uniref:Uncharacterized protein n=1 Tax=Thanatephorus cucumeris (strain AG1-IB / isolate 7/3/14) TaxID=1108050 RepID=M5CG88_THACB|nr:hypothetical protein BN14_09810 [Rhizoctonia solani AG-1 IB]
MTPQAKPAVPQSFTFYQPSVPITLPKPIDELTREEIRALIAKRTSSQGYFVYAGAPSPQHAFAVCYAGHWKTWVSGDGLTTRIREHLDNHHHHEYREKCQQEGVTVPSLDLSLAGDNTSNLVFSQRLLAEYLAQWAAVDDQAMRVVERHEFRRILLLCSRAPNLRDSDIPHRKKLTTVTSELYNAEMTCIKHELNKALGFVSVTSDLWSDEKLHSFMTVTIHYINSLGHALYSVFEDANIIDKNGHITFDNASNNDTLMAELERAFIDKGHPFERKLNRIRWVPEIGA